MINVINVAKTTRTLKLHTISVHEGVRFPCPECGHESKRRSDLYVHVRLVHKKVLDKSYFNTSIEPEIPLKKVLYQVEKKEEKEKKEESYNYEMTPEIEAFSKFMGNEYMKNSTQSNLDDKINPLNENRDALDDTAQERDSPHFKTSPFKEEIVDDVLDARKNTLNDLYDFQGVSENT